MLTGSGLDRAHLYIGRILLNAGCDQPVIGGVADHIHIVCGLPRTISPADLIMVVKKDSSKFIKTLNESLHDFHWQGGYGIFSVSRSDLTAVRHYVRSQEEHHRKESFQDEFRRLLKESGIEFDERYVWD